MSGAGCVDVGAVLRNADKLNRLGSELVAGAGVCMASLDRLKQIHAALKEVAYASPFL